MKLLDLITPLSSQSQEEQLKRINAMRTRRHITRPKKIRKQELVTKREKKTTAKKGMDILSRLTPQQIQELKESLANE